MSLLTATGISKALQGTRNNQGDLPPPSHPDPLWDQWQGTRTGCWYQKALKNQLQSLSRCKNTTAQMWSRAKTKSCSQLTPEPLFLAKSSCTASSKTQKANQTEISTLLSSAPTSSVPAKFLGFTPEPVAIVFHFPPSGCLWKEDVMCLLFPFRHFGWIPSAELTNNIPSSNSRIPRLFLAAGWSHQADFLSTTAPSCFLYQSHIFKSNNLKRSVTAVFLFCLFYSVVA